MNSFYGMPNNEDLESMLETNYQNIRPLEYVETKHSNKDGNNMFAFWTPVKDNMESYTDYKSYMDERTRRMSETPKITKWDADTTVGKIKQQMGNKSNVLSDEVGVVKPSHAETLNATASKKVITNSDIGVSKPTVTSDAAKPTGNMVGIVKPSHDELLNKTASKKVITNSDIGVPKPTVTSDAAKPTGNMVGAVKPKADMGKQNMPNMMSHAEKSKGDNVGIVKPKADMGKQSVLNFDKGNITKIK